MNPASKKYTIFEDSNFINWKKRWKVRSQENNNTSTKHLEIMRKNNPLVIPRNHKIEEVLEAAEKGDLNPLNKILNILNEPYNDQKDMSNYQHPSESNEKYQTFCGT